MMLLFLAAVSATLDIATGPAPGRYRGDNHAQVVFTSRQEVLDAACPPTADYTALACTVGKRRITLPNPCLWPNDPYAVLVCHELGHVNGWSAKHEK